MKAIGLVKRTDIDNDITIVEIYSDSSGCTSCGSGSCLSGSNTKNGKTYRAVNRNKLILEEGTLVEVELPAGKAVRALFRVIVMPVILFFASYYFIGFFLITVGGLKIAGGFIGLILGFGINFIISGKIKNKEMPVINKLYR